MRSEEAAAHSPVHDPAAAGAMRPAGRSTLAEEPCMPHLTIARRLRVVALLPVLAFIAAHWMPVFAADMQHIAHSPRAGIPDSARKATPAGMHERPRYDIETTARVEAGGQARVRDVS
jgi:hypothetical protein